EGYRTEPEALHAIAKKADGSLRDSLSIFDRIAAFAQGGTLTYDLVRQNLQLVDRALFVRLWEHIEAGDRSSILTSVQHVLDQGFDLQRFLMGFAGYIREVLLAQHPATVALLDVPESAKQQLALAAQQSSAARTAGALKRLVAADAGYRAASNARWHVEVALLDLVPDASSDEKKKPSRVAAPEAESPAHGPSTPTDSLPSPAAPAPQVPPTPSVEPVATETAAPRTQEAAPEPPAPVTAAETAPVSIPEPSEIVEAYRAPEPTSAPEPQRSEPSPVPQPASTAPRVRRTAFSLKDLDRNSAPAVPEEVPPTAETDEPEVATTERNLRPFTQQALDNAWREAADAFQDLPVVRGILQTVVPVLEKDAVVRVSLENKLQEDYLLAERDRLVPRLRQALHNDSLKIETRVEEGAVNARLVYTPDERYAFLLEKNPHLDDFRREFQLDIE
ncbi:MAG: hypothetical protein ACO31K_03830, partial [Schleiferiaceae bacterium]